MLKIPSNKKNNSNGFTLIEIMMVVLVVGIMASLVQFNFNSNRPEERLKIESERFASIFDLAAEYGLLNNIEIGLILTDNSYQFLGYDGVRWSELVDQEMLALHNLPEGLEIKLSLEDLPIEEPLLFDTAAFIEQQTNEDDFSLDDKGDSKKSEDQLGSENADKDNSREQSENSDQRGSAHRKKRIPQVYLFSGGDISAFSLTFRFQEEIANDLDYDVNKVYRVTGLYSTPLTVEALGFSDTIDE